MSKKLDFIRCVLYNFHVKGSNRLLFNKTFTKKAFYHKKRHIFKRKCISYGDCNNKIKSFGKVFDFIRNNFLEACV